MRPQMVVEADASSGITLLSPLTDQVLHRSILGSVVLQIMPDEQNKVQDCFVQCRQRLEVHLIDTKAQTDIFIHKHFATIREPQAHADYAQSMNGVDGMIVTVRTIRQPFGRTATI